MNDPDKIAEKGLCEASFYEFLKYAWPQMEGGETMDDNWHVRYVCHRLQQEVERIRRGEPRKKHLIINIPPRSGKSNIASALTPWAWITSPGMKFNSSSYADDLAKEHIIKSRRIIESEWYQEFWGGSFGMSRDQNNLHTFANDRGGKRIASSVGGGIFGKGANIFIIDDAINPQKAESEVERATSIDWFTKTASTRLNNPEVDIFILIMQRLHDLDLVGYLTKNEPDKWEKICIPAEESEAVNPPSLKKFYSNGLFFPKRFGPRYLEEQKSRQGTRTYTAQFGQSTSPEGGLLIKGAWFGRYNPAELPQGLSVRFYIDTAYTKDLNNDPSGGISGVVYEDRLYITGVSEVWLEFPEYKRHLLDWVKVQGYSENSFIWIEKKAAGHSLIQELRKIIINGETHSLNVKGEDITDSKIQRVVNQTAKLEAGRVLLPDGAHWVDYFVNQCERFPNGEHDDLVDCLTGLMRKALKFNPWG